MGCAVFFIGFCTVHLSDGPFIRPHPAFWRFLLSLSVIYEIGLVFLLFQAEKDVQGFLKFIDNSLGVPLKEKDYGGNCLLYDSGHKTDPWHNLKDKMDLFVPVHIAGWFIRALGTRDLKMCLLASIGFEFIEYTLQEQLPNFTECWWDHWVLDALLCNGLGIYLGLKLSNYLALKQREWKNVREIPGVWPKIIRVVLQFTPHDWINFEWNPLSSLTRWFQYTFVVISSLFIETGTFYIKTTLWIPPDHWLCLFRVLLHFVAGCVSIRELFEFIDNPSCTRLGTQSWMLLSIILTEALVVLKFGKHILTKPIPSVMIRFWICVVVIYTLFTFVYFVTKLIQNKTKKKID